MDVVAVVQCLCDCLQCDCCCCWRSCESVEQQSFRKWHYGVYLGVAGAVAGVVLVVAATATAAVGAVEAVSVGDSAAGSTLH